jgi:hypothetical protein
MAADKEKENKSLKVKVLGMILKGYASCFKSSGLAHVSKCADKCFEITKEKGFLTLKAKSNRLILLLKLPALIMCAMIVYFKLLEGDYLLNEITRIKLGIIGLSNISTDMDKNKLLIDALFPDTRFISNLVSTFMAIHVVLVLNFIGIKIIEGFHPLIKKSKEIKELFVAKGWALETSEYFLYSKTGILAEIPKVEAKTVINDGILWRDLDRVPKDPVECPKDRKVIFIGNGFKLKKVEFKVK